ncbi:glutamate synthase large subunit [Desulfurispira natronophila]|uniref:Glutamate synthase (NADPH/NADH) large chain n=1 Tax=Desulfurispira natronophila TaxID=682562 RepID=A0A7W7Y429_9BACT|nr:glutamate synthase large subunit [Desulfurispira natronophila]MBB5021711.1 glutamate synthase (NADPH/NADH) large chain [Desulfurispira natronophila]
MDQRVSNLAEEFKDSCGFGIIANVHNTPSHTLLCDAVTALSRMMHRGAIAADGKTGDGSGILCGMPREFMRHEALKLGISLPEQFAIAVMFLTDVEKQKKAFEECCTDNDLKVLGYRAVPMDTQALGEHALAMLPTVVQAFVVPDSIIATRRFEALLYIARRQYESQFVGDEHFHVASLSPHVVSYKGLVMPLYLQTLYPDLSDVNFQVSFALFHQRFSTNTLPRWKLAQPFRTVCHNGEINSLRANHFNSLYKFNCAKSRVFNEKEFRQLLPVLQEGVSDSANLDNMFEFLLANGVDFFKAIRCLVPPPRHNVANMPAKLRSFYEYTSGAYEPWDGPAAIGLTNGRYIGCVLDRNGLRPAKYVLTRDHRLIITSEFGVLDVPPENIRERGRLQSGQMIAADLSNGQIFYSEDIDQYLMHSQPYSKWLTDNTYYLQEFIERQFEDCSDYQHEQITSLQRYHNVTHEVVERVVKPMVASGQEPTGSMGDDCPIAAFSEKQRNFTDFFRQKFAQVTNPAIDPIREKVVMSTTTGFGEIRNPLMETPDRAKRLKTISPILSRDIFDALLSFGNPDRPRYEPTYKHATFSTAYADTTLRQAMDRLSQQVIEAVRNGGARVIILDDRGLDAHHRLIPMAMAVGYVNQQLLKHQLRHLTTTVVCTGEVMDSHSAAVMLAFGAMAIYPYLLYATALQILQKQTEHPRDIRIGLKHVYDAVTKGILKVMSKMGISAVSSYRNSALFDSIGLSSEVVEKCFPGATVLLPGLDFNDINDRIEAVHARVFRQQHMLPVFPLDMGGFYKYCEGGEYHDYSPRAVQALHHFTESCQRQDYMVFRDLINNRGTRMIRDFLQFKTVAAPLPLSEVEPVSAICARFDSAAMSLGALSPEAHEALAEALNQLGGKSNSGEGGEAAVRFKGAKNSKIKQIASGRFGVTPAYLRSAEEIQIKVAQGAKPGEGGQLPGEKVTPLIAALRFTIPGVTLISPPPHHDIYSIEDLAQLIFDLKQVNPEARISVKLVSSAGVGTIAAGVAKAYADKIVISGSDGGTGAAQYASIKHAGNPWEIGLTEAHNSLKANNLRHMVELQTDGGLKTGRDIVKAALMGAESYGFGTSLLAVLGCKLLRVCHLNRCSVGIATQSTQLREHYKGTVDKVVAYLTNVAEDVREILASLGLASLEDAIGRIDLLELLDTPQARKFDFSAITRKVPGHNTCQVQHNEPYDKNEFEHDVLREIYPVLRHPRQSILVERTIKNIHRSFGSMVSGEVARYFGDEGLSKDHIIINLTGIAGQSLGAFLINGISINLNGVANDYVGKGMHGGRIVITPSNQWDNYAAIGNTCLYGATGGKLFASGTAGERFAVRNSGALAVVEGTGDHACEYMTGGTVVVLGKTGINFGAGMTGGAAFVYDRNNDFIDRLNQELVEAKRIDVDADNEGKLYLKKILFSYYSHTRNMRAKQILDNFREELEYFWMVVPKDMKAPLNPKDGN